ncbi:glycosyltransferase family 4 protein [Burkholderia latens]|uniref:MraY family glycosyltransferase n=1 Tax=Burkholderia latens TaxID=488446 RepID=UPI001C987783|nr:glycosyltransferase family 4 protein [Burkholderia latens]MBY4694061.1 glycosyltransferase family 4 protein [Burkholderia latens]
MQQSSVVLYACLVAAVAASASAVILFLMLRTGLAWRIATDVPNSRSLHERPTPRIGGWGIVPVVVVVMFCLTPSLWLIAAGALGLAAMSQIDDRRGLTARVRFTAHLVAVGSLLAGYPIPGISPFWLVPLAITLVWMINLYNFMDGANGLAGGMALFGFGAYAVASALYPPHVSSAQLTWAAAAVAGAAAGFLIFNIDPAKLFLGDVGSIPFGFLAGALGYWGFLQEIWPIWFAPLVFSPFIADASVTLLRRLLRGEKFWQAHREHYYQRMVRSGISHRRTAGYWYLMMLAGIIIALTSMGRPVWQQWLLVVAWYGVLACVGLMIDARWRRFQVTADKNS